MATLGGEAAFVCSRQPNRPGNNAQIKPLHRNGERDATHFLKPGSLRWLVDIWNIPLFSSKDKTLKRCPSFRLYHAREKLIVEQNLELAHGGGAWWRA